VHQNALALLQGYSANGDGTGLKAFAAETAPKVQQHLSMLTAM
jgi:putative membrane protein